MKSPKGLAERPIAFIVKVICKSALSLTTRNNCFSRNEMSSVFDFLHNELDIYTLEDRKPTL